MAGQLRLQVMEQQVRQPVWRVAQTVCVLIVIRYSTQRQRDAEVERVRLAATMEAEGRWVVFDVWCIMLLSLVAQARGGSTAAEVEGAESGATAVHVSHEHDVVTPQLGRMKPLLMVFLHQGRWHQARAAAAELAAETLGVLLSSSVMQIEKDFRKENILLECPVFICLFCGFRERWPSVSSSAPQPPSFIYGLVEKHVWVYAGASCRCSSPAHCFGPSA